MDLKGLTEQQQQLPVQLKKHNITYEEYQPFYQESEISPLSTRITSYGKFELENQNMVSANIPDIQQQSPAPNDIGTQSERIRNTTSKTVQRKSFFLFSTVYVSNVE